MEPPSFEPAARPAAGDRRPAAARPLDLVHRGGFLLMLLASLALVFMMGFTKVAREQLSALEVVLWRGLLAAPLILLTARPRSLVLNNRRLFAARLLLGFGAMAAFALAARGLPLVDLNLVAKLRPLLIAVLAPLALGAGERPGRRCWTVLVTGFVGCTILLAPDLAVGSVYGLWAVLSCLLSAGAHVTLRALGPTDNARALVFWFHLGLAGLALPLVAATGGLHLPPSTLWAPLAGLAVSATASQLLMTRAYALERAPVAAVALYFGPIWALAGDLLFWGHAPGTAALVGGALIVGPTLWLTLRGPRLASSS